MELLLETNTISEPARVIPNPIVVERLASIADVNALSAPSWQHGADLRDTTWVFRG